MKNKESMKIIQPGKKKCIWMEANVVSYKLCDNHYDCISCSYDHALNARINKQKYAQTVADITASSNKINESWTEMMMMFPASQRKCRYMMTEEITRKICPNAYACGTCSFDQMMQERLQIEPLSVQAYSEAAGFEIADGFYYHEGHTWARPEYGGRVRVGVDDFAQKLFGHKGRIQLPSIGLEVKQGETGFSVQRDEESVQILSPIDGIVAHVNHQLTDTPELLKNSPYKDGWIFTIEPTKLRKNLKNLYYGEETHEYMSEEREKLFSIAHDDLHISADGGEPAEDIFEELEGKNWAKFVKIFFKS